MRESWISSVGAKRRTLSLKDEIMAWADWLASIARCGKMTGIDWQKRDQLSVIMGFCSSSVSRMGGVSPDVAEEDEGRGVRLHVLEGCHEFDKEYDEWEV